MYFKASKSAFKKTLSTIHIYVGLELSKWLTCIPPADQSELSLHRTIYGYLFRQNIRWSFFCSKEFYKKQKQKMEKVWERWTVCYKVLHSSWIELWRIICGHVKTLFSGGGIPRFCSGLEASGFCQTGTFWPVRILWSQFIQKRCFDNQRYSNSNLETLDKMQVSCTFLWFGGVI